MGKFSRAVGRDVQSPLAGYNPYEASLKQVDKISEGKTAEGAVPTIAPTQAPPVGEPAGVVPVPQEQAPAGSPVLQQGETTLPQSREELVALTEQEIDPDTGQRYTPEKAQQKVDVDLQVQEEEGFKPFDLSFDTDEKLIANAELESVDKGEASAIVTNGTLINSAINETINPTLFDPNNASSVEFLAKNGLIGQDGKVDQRLGNAVAIAMPALIRDDVIKREKRDDTLEASDEQLGDTDIQAGPSFDPGLTQGNLMNEVLKLVNPAVGDKGFYKKDHNNNLTKDQGAAGIEAGLWQSLYNKGFLEEYKPDPNKPSRWRWSPKAVDYYNNTRDVMKQINPKQRISVSLTPAFGGRTYGKEVLSKSAKPISVKSKVDENQKVENAVKDTLGRMPMRVNAGRLQMISLLFKEVTGNNLHPEHKYSTHPMAHVLRIDKARWDAFRDKAFLMQDPNYPRTDAQLDAHATKLMEDQINQIQVELADAADLSGDAFYNKWFHAAANGRYHVLNTVLNPQNSKLARNLVENAVSVSFQPAKGLGEGFERTQFEKNARYIIARNLRTDIDVENVGWNATVKDFDKFLPGWAQIGQQIVEQGTLPEALMQKFQENKKSYEDWGNTLQSYIDAYNYHNAIKTGSNFTPKAHTQHDGKANGLAIQGIQAGDYDLMRKSGLIYDNEDHNVIPDGNIRTAFIKNMKGAINTALSHSPTEAAVFTEAINNLQSDQRKELAKAPLMETAYGKWHEYHKETAYKFIKKNTEFTNFIKGQTGKSDIQIVLDLNKIISNSLRSTLNLDHQQKLKRVGDLWSALGTTPVVRGPLGNYIFFGSKTFNPDIDPNTGLPAQAVYQTAQGPLRRTLGTVGASTAGQPIAKKVITEAGKVEPTQQRVGSVIPNQLPVLTVQHIDSAVIADTVLRVNENRINKQPLHMIPVHDAIITDATSVDKYHQQVNKSFVDINKGYNIAKEVRKGFMEAINQWKSSIKPDQNYNVHPEFGQYQSLFAILNEANDRIKEAQAENRKPSAGNLEIVRVARQIGIQPSDERVYKGQVNYVKGRDLVHIMTLLARKLNSQRGLNSWIEAIEVNQKKHWNKIKDKTYQYN